MVDEPTYRIFTFEDINRDFVYEEDTGKLFRIQVTELNTSKIYRGKLGPAPVKYKGQSIMCTHVMFMLKTGRWPEEGKVIDHKDRVGSNHVWTNLREATFQQNAFNQGKRYLKPTTEDLGKGVFKSKHNSYVVVVAGVYHGTFHSLIEANQIAGKAVKEAHGEWAYNLDEKEV